MLKNKINQKVKGDNNSLIYISKLKLSYIPLKVFKENGLLLGVINEDGKSNYVLAGIRDLGIVYNFGLINNDFKLFKTSEGNILRIIKDGREMLFNLKDLKFLGDRDTPDMWFDSFLFFKDDYFIFYDEEDGEKCLISLDKNGNIVGQMIIDNVNKVNLLRETNRIIYNGYDGDELLDMKLNTLAKYKFIITFPYSDILMAGIDGYGPTKYWYIDKDGNPLGNRQEREWLGPRNIGDFIGDYGNIKDENNVKYLVDKKGNLFSYKEIGISKYIGSLGNYGVGILYGSTDVISKKNINLVIFKKEDKSKKIVAKNLGNHLGFGDYIEDVSMIVKEDRNINNKFKLFAIKMHNNNFAIIDRNGNIINLSQYIKDINTVSIIRDNIIVIYGKDYNEYLFKIDGKKLFPLFKYSNGMPVKIRNWFISDNGNKLHFTFANLSKDNRISNWVAIWDKNEKTYKLIFQQSADFLKKYKYITLGKYDDKYVYFLTDGKINIANMKNGLYLIKNNVVLSSGDEITDIGNTQWEGKNEDVIPFDILIIWKGKKYNFINKDGEVLLDKWILSNEKLVIEEYWLRNNEIILKIRNLDVEKVGIIELSSKKLNNL